MWSDSISSEVTLYWARHLLCMRDRKCYHVETASSGYNHVTMDIKKVYTHDTAGITKYYMHVSRVKQRSQLTRDAGIIETTLS